MEKNEPKRSVSGCYAFVAFANWASVSLTLGAQPDFYSLWASGRPLICIPDATDHAVHCLLFTVSSEHCKSLLTCSAPPIIFFVHSHYPVPGI